MDKRTLFGRIGDMAYATMDEYRRAMDSTLAYFINQLDLADPVLHTPLFSVSWGRDIKLRSGVSFVNESTSFLRSTFAAGGTLSATGKPWVTPTSTTLPGITINGERVVLPVRMLGQELSYTSVELERSRHLGTPIDAAKLSAMNDMYQMWIDEQVYIGDAELGIKGLLNSDSIVAHTLVAQNAGATSRLWSQKTPDEILKDVNEILTAAWLASGQTVCPDKLGIPAAQFAYLVSTKVSSQAEKSIMTYLRENSLCMAVNGRPLDIVPMKYLAGRGESATDRMIAYTNAENRVRFPLVPIRREQPYYLGIRFAAPYIWAFGELEILYPETLLYRDGI